MADAGTACGCVAPDGPALWRWGRIIFAAILAVNSMAVALAVNTAEDAPADLRVVRLGLLGVTVLVALLVSGPLLRGAWEALRARRIAVEFLFLLTLAGALGVSLQSMWRGEGPVYFEVLSILLVVYAFGAELNVSARERARKMLESYSSTLRMARVRHGEGTESLIPAEAVRPGDHVVVLPGEMAPVDGVLLGESVLLEESSLRGEFAPLCRQPGQAIQAGTAVLDAQVILEARPGEASQLDTLLCATEASLAAPSASQRAADRLSQWFLPVVATTALLTFLGWSFFVPVGDALFHAMAVLLVACPCALGFGTPLALNTAVNRLREKGIHLPRVADVEALAAVDTVVFDKTGTLSSAEAVADHIHWTPAFAARKAETMRMLATAEEGLAHPYARALHSLCRREGTAGMDASKGWIREHLRILPGVGIEAELTREGKRRHTVTIRGAKRAPQQGQEPGVEILVDGEVAGHAIFREALHPARDAAWAGFASIGVGLHLLTGDSTARAERTGIRSLQSGVDAVGKQAFVAALRGQGRHVLFVGDGMNDAAAMAAADVSLAVAHGAPLAKAVSSGLWFDADPRNIPVALRIARQTVERVRANFRWALSYNIGGMALASAGVLHPVTAAILMVVSSVLVTWRALALLNHPEDALTPHPESPSQLAVPLEAPDVRVAS